MSLPDHFREHVQTAGLIHPGERLVVACSGGADSVALLRLVAGSLEALAPAAVTVAHLDHGLRPDSAGDAAFVVHLADGFDLPSIVRRRDVQPQPGESPEAAARKARYGFLKEAADDAEADAVLLAHHLDDQAETVLFRALSGTGIAGLAGMPTTRPLTDRCRVLRPLLPFRRAELREWLRTQGPWREDPTNVDGNVRARLRNEAFPLLADCVGRDPAPLLARLAGHASEAVSEWTRDDAAFLEGFMSQDGATVRLEPGNERLPQAMRKRLLAAAAARVRGDALPPSQADLERLVRLVDGDDSETVSAIDVSRDRGGVVLAPAGGTADSSPLSAPLAVPGSATGVGITVRADTSPASPGPFLEKLRDRTGSVELLDAAAVVGDLVLRSWSEDDVFVALGSDTGVRVNGYLARRGVAAVARRAVPVVADGAGIVWVVGHGIAHRARVQDGTSALVVLRVQHPESKGRA